MRKTILIFKKLLSLVVVTPEVKKFKKFARQNRLKINESKGYIFVEDRDWAFDEISLLHFLPEAASHFSAKIMLYRMDQVDLLRSVIWKLVRKFSVPNAISKCESLFISSRRGVYPEHSNAIGRFTSGTITREDLEDFRYRDILLGDLIYDQYLRSKSSVTINFEDPNFVTVFSSMLQYVDKWIDIFQKFKIHAVLVSDPCYQRGIPARIAMQRNIEVFCLDVTIASRMNKENPNPYLNECKNFQENFANLPGEARAQHAEIAKKRLELRIQGIPDDLRLTRPNKHMQEIKSPKDGDGELVKVLIALHDFNDAPHFMGKAFYPDFAVWLEEIGEMTKDRNLVCFIKPHPYALTENSIYLKGILSRFAHFQLISSESTVASLAEAGIDYCITVYGSVAHEFPYLGIPVINSSLLNLHKDYKFSYTPKNVEEFKEILSDLKQFKFIPNIEDLYFYYYMRFVFNLISWCMPEYQRFLSKFRTHRVTDNRAVYKEFFLAGNHINLLCTRAAVANYLKSNDLVLGRKHYSDVCRSVTRGCKCYLMREEQLVMESIL